MSDWDKFFDKKVKEIAKEKRVLDAGGGAGFQKSLALYKEIFKNCDYQNLDINPKLAPKILGDIHNIPISDEDISLAILTSPDERSYPRSPTARCPRSHFPKWHRSLKPTWTRRALTHPN